MYHKKLITSIVVVLVALASVFVLSQIWGAPVKEIIVGIMVYVMYGVLITAYLLRFALFFLGVFAIYRLLQEKYTGQAAV